MALTLPKPPTPPTIDKGETTSTAPKIDAHQFFEMQFEQEDELPFKIRNENPAPIEKTVETPVQKPVEKSVEMPPQTVERKTTTPEDMARDAVANGAGALTKKTITRPNAETNSTAPTVPTQNVPVRDTKRGKEILREFQNEDKQTLQTTDTPRSFNRHQNETHGGFYWIVTLILVGILSIVFVKKFLIKDKPALKKSDLFSDSSERLKAVTEKVTAPKISAVDTPIKKSPPKKDDDKGKHFEVRV